MAKPVAIDDHKVSDDNSVATISFKHFLEQTQPSITKTIADVWSFVPGTGHKATRSVQMPDIKLYCTECKGERSFRSILPKYSFHSAPEYNDIHPSYLCGDCRKRTKKFALNIVYLPEAAAELYKYGEIPPFGVPIPNRVLRLVGSEDAALFKKGRQCENLGYGIAAFAYYRRIVENHKNDLFDEIIKVCRVLQGEEELVAELESAKKEISFSKSMDVIKTALPDGLLIQGHNPINALHAALSIGIHNESDEACLEYAQAVRRVLSELVERAASLKGENIKLNESVQLLLDKRK